MATINLKIAELRKRKGITQQELADVLGVSFQTISKWETGVTMPDLSILPTLADFFCVTTDELLGLKALEGEQYIPSIKNSNTYWNSQLEYLLRTRKQMWNIDYIQFLIEKVWNISKPINILDCGCGYGFLGTILLPLLPDGSTYTGIDFSENLIKAGEEYFSNTNFKANLICDNVLTYTDNKKYDFVINQAVLRHLDNPKEFLMKMILLAKDGGIVACIEVSRPIESDGLYIKGMDYSYLCEKGGFYKLWDKELESQGRDYSISMKIPDMMKQFGLKNVDVRLNDKVSFITMDDENYDQIISDFINSHGWHEQILDEDDDKKIEFLINHGMDKKDADEYCKKQKKIARFLNKNKANLTYTHILGLMISYGRK